MGILICLLPFLLIGAASPSNGQDGSPFRFLEDSIASREQNMMSGYERGLHPERKMISEAEICNAIGG